MTNIDQFESVFKAADKPVFHRRSVPLRRRTVVCDCTGDEAERFRQHCQALLPVDSQAEWEVIAGHQFDSIGELLHKLSDQQPDVILTHRNLHVPAAEHPYSLGAYLDVLTQATSYPVFVVPRLAGDDEPEAEAGANAPCCVMALSDELVGEDDLVNYAFELVAHDGTLFLAHVEDEVIFNRYVAAIAKIPAIDTETARESILQRLLQDSANYAQSVVDVAASERPSLTVTPVIRTGHRVELCVKMIEDDRVDLLVLNTKDEEQMAMHGLAYPLAVQLRKIPLLLL